MSEVGNISWNENLEKYFADTGEKANCLSIVHKRAEEVYSHRRTYIDLPVICISGLVGFMSVGSTTMFEGLESIKIYTDSFVVKNPLRQSDTAISLNSNLQQEIKNEIVTPKD